MENDTAKDIVKELELVSAYAGQLSHVLHRHQIILKIDSIVQGPVDEHISLINSTIGTINEVLGLLRDGAGTNQNRLFSEEGRRYVKVLILECSEMLQKIPPTAAKACLKRERKKKRKNSKKAKAELVVPVLPKQLKLDEERFLNDLDNAIWYRVYDDQDVYMARLKDVQLHLLLVYQVVTVGSLSRDLTSGKVDIQKIVSYHEQINHTADLIWIVRGNRRHRLHSSSSSSTTLSESDSDSDVHSFVSRRRRSPGPPPKFYNPPPPPPPGINIARPLPPFPKSYSEVIDLNTPNANPPSYDSHRGLGTPPFKKTLTLQDPPASPYMFPNEKGRESKTNPETNVEEQQVAKKTADSPKPCGQLFNSPHNRLSFKIKSLFRSKESLATEMKKVLEDSSSVLEAFLIQGPDIRPIPHSAFHSLEATHMRTIMSQLNDNSWFETFSHLTRTEHNVLDNAMYPPGFKTSRREVVVLKVLQENRNNAWMRFLAGKLSTPVLPQHLNHRLILAILREPLANGERKAWVAHGIIPIPDLGRACLPPPPSQVEARGSLSQPLQPPAPKVGGCMPPQTQLNHLPPVSPPRGPPPPLDQVSDDPWMDAYVAFIKYRAYTLQIADTQPDEPRRWPRITTILEDSGLAEILARIDAFTSSGSTVIDAELHLPDHLTTQMTQLLKELQSRESNRRVEWSWVEVSLYDSRGRIAICSRDNGARSPTTMHLIARQSLKPGIYPSLRLLLKSQGPEFSMPPPSFQNPHAPRPGPPPPPPPPPPPLIKRGRPRRWGGGMDSVNFDSSGSESDSSFEIRRKRERERRRCRNNGRVRHRNHDGESSDDGDDEEDVIRIPVVFMRGDDVVKKLLDLWTPDGSQCDRD